MPVVPWRRGVRRNQWNWWKWACPEGAAPVVIGEPPRKNMFLEYWRMVGGGSLAISLLVHAGLIAVFVAIVTVTVHEPKVDFLPGGGSKQGQEASQELAHQVQQKKKRTAMNKTTPMRKVVSQSANAAIALPDVPIDAVDVPDMAIPMGGMSAGAGFGEHGSGRRLWDGQGDRGPGGVHEPAGLDEEPVQRGGAPAEAQGERRDVRSARRR